MFYMTILGGANTQLHYVFFVLEKERAIFCFCLRAAFAIKFEAAVKKKIKRNLDFTYIQYYIFC